LRQQTERFEHAARHHTIAIWAHALLIVLVLVQAGQTHGPNDGGSYDGLAIMADCDVSYLCYVFAHLRICAFLLFTHQQNHPENNKNIENTV
jgi:hypothetical protein